MKLDNEIHLLQNSLLSLCRQEKYCFWLLLLLLLGLFCIKCIQDTLAAAESISQFFCYFHPFSAYLCRIPFVNQNYNNIFSSAAPLHGYSLINKRFRINGYKTNTLQLQPVVLLCQRKKGLRDNCCKKLGFLPNRRVCSHFFLYFFSLSRDFSLIADGGLIKKENKCETTAVISQAVHFFSTSFFLNKRTPKKSWCYFPWKK